MSRDQLVRFNYLSKKVMEHSASTTEMEELSEFLKSWNRSVEHNASNQTKNNAE